MEQFNYIRNKKGQSNQLQYSSRGYSNQLKAILVLFISLFNF